MNNCCTSQEKVDTSCTSQEKVDTSNNIFL